ncbi:MAG: hypothetical protein GY862_14160 [Gammaproteobacteria bacterium]|nr:hypothetical protein [Gammaproteobacteria bacterium]
MQKQSKNQMAFTGYPTEPGWYWHKNIEKGHPPMIFKICFLGGHWSQPYFDLYGKEQYFSWNEFGGEWVGPIPKPEGW